MQEVTGRLGSWLPPHEKKGFNFSTVALSGPKDQEISFTSALFNTVMIVIAGR